MNRHSTRRCLPLVVALAAISALSAYGQDKDIQSAKDGIGRLKNLPGSVQQVLAVVRATNFGPFQLNGRCEYDWRWYCFGNCFYYQWSWTFPSYTWLKSDLQGKYERVGAQASQFNAVFYPVKTWLTGSLPEISQQMEAAAARMQNNDAATVKDAIAQLDGQLTASGGRLQSGYEGLTGFNRNLNAVIEQATSRSAMEGVINRDQAMLEQKLREFPCGQDDVRNKYNGIRDTVRNQFNQVEAAGRSFGLTSAQTDTDVSTVLGAVLATRGSLANVLKSLQNASLTPAGAVQQLRLKVVAGQWRELSEYARQQLGN